MCKACEMCVARHQKISTDSNLDSHYKKNLLKMRLMPSHYFSPLAYETGGKSSHLPFCQMKGKPMCRN